VGYCKARYFDEVHLASAHVDDSRRVQRTADALRVLRQRREVKFAVNRAINAYTSSSVQQL
jgi:hypothetical protein